MIGGGPEGWEWCSQCRYGLQQGGNILNLVTERMIRYARVWESERRLRMMELIRTSEGTIRARGEI